MTIDEAQGAEQARAEWDALLEEFERRQEQIHQMKPRAAWKERDRRGCFLGAIAQSPPMLPVWSAANGSWGVGCPAAADGSRDQSSSRVWPRGMSDYRRDAW